MQALTVSIIKTPTTLQEKKLFWSLFARMRGGKNRINIISILKKDPSNLHQISQELDIDYKTVQHHVKILSENNLVSKTSNGYGATYFLSEKFEKSEPIFDEIVSKLKKWDGESF